MHNNTGSWKNPHGGSFGQFTARRQPPAGSLAAICLCHVCGRALKPGELRYNCAVCMPMWCCCANCETTQRMQADGSTQHTQVTGAAAADTSSSQPHPHPLAPELVFRMQTARGKHCGALVLDAFARFESRPFIGTRLPTQPLFSWRSYAQVHAQVLKTSLPSKGEKDPPSYPHTFLSY